MEALMHIKTQTVLEAILGCQKINGINLRSAIRQQQHKQFYHPRATLVSQTLFKVMTP
jgi:hypothetical protein